jgi:transcriptional regulator with XRE-family HTH domain
MAISNANITSRLAALAVRLKRARLEARLTQQALADLSGVSTKTIGNAEDSGQVSLDTLLRLLDGLGRTAELDTVLKDLGPSPIALAKQHGKRRQRVRSKSVKERAAGGEWQW